jgi:hypothetical protein
MQVADGAPPFLRLDDARALASAVRRAFFGAVEARKGEGPPRGLAEAQREVVLARESLDLGLVERGLVRSSHRRQLWTADGARAKAACYDAAVIVRRIALFLALVAAPAAAACAKSSQDSFDPNAPPASSDAGSFSAEAGRPDPTGAGEVFGHSENTLYRVDTVTRSVTEVGTFNGCTNINDIALDEQSNIYASTATELFYVETNTGNCTRIAGGTFPNSLSFVPAGTVEPDREALVGFQGADYVKIDPKSGVVTKLGAIGEGLASSGDVVSAKGGKTFVTVTGKGCSDSDCLVEIDPATGALAHNWGPIGKSQVFGLAFWAGELYAFTNAGELALLTIDTGVLVATPIAVANAPMTFRGAGSTTSAPTGPVR